MGRRPVLIWSVKQRCPTNMGTLLLDMSIAACINLKWLQAITLPKRTCMHVLVHACGHTRMHTCPRARAHKPAHPQARIHTCSLSHTGDLHAHRLAYPHTCSLSRTDDRHAQGCGSPAAAPGSGDGEQAAQPQPGAGAGDAGDEPTGVRRRGGERARFVRARAKNARPLRCVRSGFCTSKVAPSSMLEVMRGVGAAMP